MTTIAAPAVLAPTIAFAPRAVGDLVAPRAPSPPAPDHAAAAPASGGGPGEYWAPAQAKEGAALLRSLHEIVRAGHRDRGYAEARDGLFSLVADPDNDDQVPDVYTGELRSPVSDRSSAMETNLNAEHTWPQSKGATGIAQSDLHQLLPADVETNSRRGNFPYGEVEEETWSVGSGVDRSVLGTDRGGEQVFEPRDAMKGDIARGLLYFYTRYDHSRPSKYTLDNLKHELPDLLRWHEQDPVDDLERQRNDAVFSVQGNRNPYIDRPEWVKAVDFPALPNLVGSD